MAHRSTTAFSFRIRLLGTTLLLRDCLGYILQYIKLLYIQFNSSTLFTPQQVRWENDCGECRHPPAGRTDFHPADRQGKDLIADEKKRATDIRLASSLTPPQAFGEQKAIAP
jgi:hypothetical protein